MEIDTGESGVIRAVTSNLSREGLAAIGDSAMQLGDHVLLRFGNGPQRAATVVWRKGRRTGFKFDRELDLPDQPDLNLQQRS